MNAHFVNVKVDREERPDVDAVYMDATTALTGQGGWPMTCLLTPDGAAVLRRHVLPARRSSCNCSRRSPRRGATGARRCSTAGQRIVDALAQAADGDPGTRPGARCGAARRRCRRGWCRSSTATNGGFGAGAEVPAVDGAGVPAAPARAHRRSDLAGRWPTQTLEAMARGGMYDQLAGGFARYSVDAHWVVPHFEKMLYDNALLLRVYLHWWRLTGSPLAERIARETADFLLRDLGTPEGGFASALDADTDGVEGLTYVWTPAQLREVLGADAERGRAVVRGDRGRARSSTAPRPCSCASTPTTPRSGRTCAGGAAGGPHDPAAAGARRQGRDGVERPGDRRAGRGRRRCSTSRATSTRRERCAELLLGTHLVDGRLRRTSRDGAVGAALGVAEDYGDLADGPARAAPGERRGRAGCSAAGELLDVAVGAVRRRPGRLLRHRRRRRGAGAPPAGPDRQRDAVRSERAGRGAGDLLGADRLARAPRRWPRTRCGSSGCSACSSHASSAGRWRPPRRWSPARCRSRRRPGTVPTSCRTAWLRRPPGRGGRRGAPDAEGVAVAGRPAAGGRCPGRLRVPWDGLRPAGHDRRRPRGAARALTGTAGTVGPRTRRQWPVTATVVTSR